MESTYEYTVPLPFKEALFEFYLFLIMQKCLDLTVSVTHVNMPKEKSVDSEWKHFPHCEGAETKDV